jgi:hypothetical protein
MTVLLLLLLLPLITSGSISRFVNIRFIIMFTVFMLL